ncbi:hypothetical protein LSAT2_020510 [Lamellibrachia satsuma]|nr:hypothetical protein LSAT2_020510 [Lamellibrachia satsuma]
MSTLHFLFLLSAIIELTTGCRRRRQRPCPTLIPRITLPPTPPSGWIGGTGRPTAKSIPPLIQPEVTKIPPTAKPIPPLIQPEVAKIPPTAKPIPPLTQAEVTESPPTAKPSPPLIQPNVTKTPPTRSTLGAPATTQVSTATRPIRTTTVTRPWSTPPTVRASPTTNDNPRQQSGEVTPPGSMPGGSTGGDSEGEVQGTEIPVCRTLSTNKAICTTGKTTVTILKSPSSPPPSTDIYVRSMVEGFLVLLLVVVAILLVMKMRNSRTAAGGAGADEPERLIVSGTTSYEEIGNINSSRRTDSTASRQSHADICGQGVHPELAIVAGNLYENAREISRPRINSVHTYENIDAILYEEMRRQLDQQADGHYEKLQRTSSRQPDNACSGGLYNTLAEAEVMSGPEATNTKGAMKHSLTTDLERFADCSDESGGHM